MVGRQAQIKPAESSAALFAVSNVDEVWCFKRTPKEESRDHCMLYRD